MNTTTLVTLETAKLRATSLMAEAMSHVEIATDFTITNADDAELAAVQLRGISKFLKEYEAERKSLTDPYNKLAKDIKAEFDAPLAKAGEADAILRKTLLAYTTEERRKEQERQAAEDRRLAAERAEAAERVRKEEERLAKLKTPEAIAKAEVRVEEARAVQDVAEVTSVAVVAEKKLSGFGVRDNWQAEYDKGGLETILAAIVGGRDDLLQYVQWNEKQVTQVVKAMKGNTRIPGVRAVNNPTTAVR